MIFSEYHGRNVKELKTLHPNVQELFYSFLNRIAIAGIPIQVTDAKRTKEQQHQIYGQGRWLPGPIVSNADNDTSYHVFGLAIDLYPLKRTWYGTTIINPDVMKYEQIAMIGNDLGIEWGFAMWKFDRPHYQYSDGLSIAELRTGKIPKQPLITPIAKSPEDEQTLKDMNEKLLHLGILPLA